MPLFECSQCGAIDNTAISTYWDQQYDYLHTADSSLNLALKEGFRPKCSECATGTWHGKFPKDNAKEKGYVPDPKMPGFIMPKGGWK